MKKLICYFLLLWAIPSLLLSFGTDDPIDMFLKLIIPALVIELAVTDLTGSRRLV